MENKNKEEQESEKDVNEQISPPEEIETQEQDSEEQEYEEEQEDFDNIGGFDDFSEPMTSFSSESVAPVLQSNPDVPVENLEQEMQAIPSQNTGQDNTSGEGFSYIENQPDYADNYTQGVMYETMHEEGVSMRRDEQMDLTPARPMHTPGMSHELADNTREFNMRQWQSSNVEGSGRSREEEYTLGRLDKKHKNRRGFEREEGRF